MPHKGTRRLRDGREAVIHTNHGVRKICRCPRRAWPKCPHAWHLSFTHQGTTHRFSLDRHVGRRLATKAEAQAEADRIKTAIREGTFGSNGTGASRRPSPPSVPDGRATCTFHSFAGDFVTRYSKAAVPGRRRRGTNGAKASWRDDVAMIGKISDFKIAGRRLGDRKAADITPDEVEAFLQHLAHVGKAASTRNHYLGLFRTMGKWAMRKGYRASPFLDGEVRQEAQAGRSRRLVGDEESRLLAVARPRLQRLIIAALETGARRGELLSLQWREVDLERRQIRLLARKTKDGDARSVPISTKLGGVLELARTGPDGDPLLPDAYVFGNAVGERITTFKTAWATARRKAQITDLHFHDLRHEAGSRFLEAGWPLHHVQEMLGHSNIKQTSIYLNVKQHGLQESMRKFDRSRPACKIVARNPPTDHRPTCKTDPASDRNSLVH